jgi:hypothetical protein
MKLINSILEALFFPKPNNYLDQDYSNGQSVNGLILIPVPEKSNADVRRVSDYNNR